MVITGEARLRATRFVTSLDHFLDVREKVRSGGFELVSDYVQATEMLIRATQALDPNQPPFDPINTNDNAIDVLARALTNNQTPPPIND